MTIIDVSLLLLCVLAIGLPLIFQDMQKSNHWRQYTTNDEDFERIQKHLSERQD